MKHHAWRHVVTWHVVIILIVVVCLLLVSCRSVEVPPETTSTFEPPERHLAWWVWLIAILAGLLVGGLLSTLISRTTLKKHLPKRKETTPLTEKQPNLTVPNLFKDTTTVFEEKQKLTVPNLFKETTAVAKEKQKLTVPNLFVEIENNYKIATEPWTGKLLAFQTSVWDTRLDEVRTLPANHQEALTQAYTDIGLANKIVWLADELGRRSHSLDESYLELCTNIAVNLERITSLLKQ